jgi:ribosomal protein S18 acetylase RimI-like enzyme
MPRLHDKNQIRAILRRDARWCVYALGDLEPRMFAKCQWFTPDLTMVLHDYGTCILFAHGTGSLREALDHATFPVHLQVRRDALEEIKKYAIVTDEKSMLRMGLDRAGSARATDLSAVARRAKVESTEGTARVCRLTERDIDALKRLYADGESTGESPDFFYDSMVSDGVFCGIFEGRDLIAVTGTHLVSREESAAAIGNVYVRRDRRGAGLSRLTTMAVLEDLRGIETIGLNVRADNAAAIRVYESLGFAVHCQFCEGLAVR